MVLSGRCRKCPSDIPVHLRPVNRRRPRASSYDSTPSEECLETATTHYMARTAELQRTNATEEELKELMRVPEAIRRQGVQKSEGTGQVSGEQEARDKRWRWRWSKTEKWFRQRKIC